MEKTFSLRKKRSVRPKISAPQQITGPVDMKSLPKPSSALQVPERPQIRSGGSSGSSSNAVPRKSLQANGNTADYVKRRYSTRVTQLPKNFDGAPAMPSVPGQFLSQPPARAERPGAAFPSEKVAVDLRALQDPKLQTEQCKIRFISFGSLSDHY